MESHLAVSSVSAPFSILFEDNHCLAVAKPAGLPTQAPAGIPSLEALAKQYLKERYGKPGNVYLGVPHRLDRPVSGVVLFARNSKAASRLAVEFQERLVRKVYWAWVEGVVPIAQPDGGTWEDTIRKREDEARAECVAPGTPGGKLARLRYRVRARHLADSSLRTLLEIELQTGRMHQIRVQAASRGHPVWGDLAYGSVHPFGPLAEDERQRVIALHARSLRFRHPLSFEFMTLTAEPPAYWPLAPGEAGNPEG